MERCMLGISLKDRKRASWIREQTKVDDILLKIKRKQWQWAGHVARRRDNRWTKTVTDWEITGVKRPRGRPYTRWRDDIRKFDRKWKEKAQDRNDWKHLGEAYVLQWNVTS